MKRASRAIIFSACALAPCRAATEAMNPIRKVVTMLQNMQKKVSEEGEKEEEMFEKFMCYCKNSGETLGQSIEDGSAKIEEHSASIKSSSELKLQTEESLSNNQDSKSAAKDAVAEATAIREKEATEYAKVKSDLETNIAAIGKAVKALESGMAGSFLQTTDAGFIKRYTMEQADLPDGTRQEMLAFLSGSQGEGYAPQSGEITGILKTMGDEMSASLKEANDEETSAIQNYEELMAAKKKELNTLQSQIETEMTRIGNLGVELANLNNDVEDTQEALADDAALKAELEKGCATKEAEWEEVKKTRADELVALAETIKVLNDDDALDLFTKTLPGAAASLLQMTVSAKSQKAKALQIIRAQSKLSGNPGLDFLALALNGKQQGFEPIIKMVDDMVVNLKKDQGNDDSKKEYCEKAFDESDDKRKGLEQSISDSGAAITDMTGSIETLKGEIEALTAGIKALDKSVAEATEQRKEENAEHKELMANNGIAKEVLGYAKNRLNKFYNPKLYKPPPKRELTEAERITVNMGGTAPPTAAPGGIAGTGIGASLVQVRSHSQMKKALPPPPETFGPYTKKTEESGGVIAMIDLLVKDLDKEMQESDVMEKDAQADYEKMMADSAEKRAADTKSLGGKSAAKADTEDAVQAEQDKKAGTEKTHMATMEYIGSLHGECDWLLKHHPARKEARTGEIESLGNAKAVLSGADYSFVQTSRLRGLRRRVH